MVRYLVEISYDGSKFYGFQRLNDYPTIQKEIEKSLKKVFKKQVEIKGAGRTDRMVHANGQCFSFDAPFYIEEDNLRQAIQRNLHTNYILIKKCKEVDNTFHARFSAKKKKYIYKINIGDFNPLWEDYYYQPKFKINPKLLKRAAKVFVGTHDYKNFVSGAHANTISHIYKIKIYKKKNIIYTELEGKAFYKYMVRNIVGALIDYNRGKVTIKELKEMLEKPEILQQLTTISPNGLYLEKIYY